MNSIEQVIEINPDLKYMVFMDSPTSEREMLTIRDRIRAFMQSDEKVFVCYGIRLEKIDDGKLL